MSKPYPNVYLLTLCWRWQYFDIIIHKSVLEIHDGIVLCPVLVVQGYELHSGTGLHSNMKQNIISMRRPYPNNQLTLLLVKREPIEGHGAGDGGFDATP